MIGDIAERIRQNDPAHGKWCTSRHTYEVWVDASSLTRVCSLWRTQHINLSELDAILKGVNLALQWGATELHLFRLSICALVDIKHTYWKSQNTKVANEMLIRRGLSTLEKLIQEYNLLIMLSLVTSSENRANKLSVLRWWYDVIKKEVKPACSTCASMVNESSPNQICHTLPEWTFWYQADAVFCEMSLTYDIQVGHQGSGQKM